jgi:hypothetical protein
MSLRVTIPSTYTFTGRRRTKLPVPLNFADSGLESYIPIIPIVVYAAPPEDEQEVLEICRGC